MRVKFELCSPLLTFHMCVTQQYAFLIPRIFLTLSIFSPLKIKFFFSLSLCNIFWGVKMLYERRISSKRNGKNFMHSTRHLLLGGRSDEWSRFLFIDGIMAQWRLKDIYPHQTSFDDRLIHLFRSQQVRINEFHNLMMLKTYSLVRAGWNISIILLRQPEMNDERWDSRLKLNTTLSPTHRARGPTLKSDNRKWKFTSVSKESWASNDVDDEHCVINFPLFFFFHVHSSFALQLSTHRIQNS